MMIESYQGITIDGEDGEDGENGEYGEYGRGRGSRVLVKITGSYDVDAEIAK